MTTILDSRLVTSDFATSFIWITTGLAFLGTSSLSLITYLYDRKYYSSGYERLSDDPGVRQENEIPLDYPRSSPTHIETSIFVFCIVQLVQSIVSCATFPFDIQDELDITMLSYIWIAIWIFLVYLVECSVRRDRSWAPRWLAGWYLCNALFQAAVFYRTWHPDNKGSAWMWNSVSSLLILILLVILDVVNPVKNASEKESILLHGRAPCKEETASLWSQISYSWINPLLARGQEQLLEPEDLPHLSQDDKMDRVVQRWHRFRNKKNSVIWDLMLMTWKFGAFQILVALISTTLDFSIPFFMNRILFWIQNRTQNEDITYGLILLMGMFVCVMIKEILSSQVSLSGRHWSMQLRSVLFYEILSKSLRRTGGDQDQESKDKGREGTASKGKIVSLMSSDSNEIRSIVTDVHQFLVEMPLSIIMSVAGLLILMGTPALAGLVVIVITSPLSGIVMARIYRIMAKTRTFTDKRIHLTNETLQGIRIIKYLGWEPQFIKRILAIRETEIQSRFQVLISWLLLISLSWGASILVTFTSFFFYTVVAGNRLDAATAFTSITLLDAVSTHLNSISESVSELLNFRVVLGRLNSYLSEEELEKYRLGSAEENVFSQIPPTATTIGFQDAVFEYYRTDNANSTKKEKPRRKWPWLVGVRHGYNPVNNQDDNDSSQTRFSLKNLDCIFPSGQLTAIIGPTGAGKTSVLLALLGEMKRNQGISLVQINRQRLLRTSQKSGIAYVPQTAWLLNATIRDNILFGEPYDQDRYEQAIRVCALERDLQQLTGGDLTEIGEKGVNLSGGQKQRVSLARAVYSKAPVVLLDDPLSAVDAPTARHLLQECILKALSGRTILLVTHAVGLVVPKADYVVAISNGEIIAKGRPSEIAEDPTMKALILSELNFSDTKNENGNVETEIASSALDKKETKLVEKETKAAGSIQWSTYQSYLQSCGGWAFLGVILLGFGIQISANYLSNWWIERWTDSLSFISNWSSDTNSGDTIFYISIYGVFSLVELFALLFMHVSKFMGGIRASRVLHEKLVRAVLGSPLRFFEVTPVGRIINRFSKDMSDVDGTLMHIVVRFGLFILSAVIRIFFVVFVTPYFLFATVFLFFYYRIANRYLLSSRELKRIESVSSSPIYAQFGETLNGVSTIRAYGSENRVLEEIKDKVDANHRAYFYLFAANRWMYFRTAFLSALIVFFAGVSILLSSVTAGWAGLAFNFANKFTNTMVYIIQTHSSMEMSMNSVERIEEYAALEQEPPAIVENYRAPEDWPSEGKVEVKNLRLRYAPNLPDVLKGINFTVNPREKLAIVGRTGAGKSTLSIAFFRIMPFVEGTIIIDGVDISRLGLQDLRSRLTIIPQDPILFEGTLRENLDPNGEKSDSELWDALKATRFLESVSTSPPKDEYTDVEDTEQSVSNPNEPISLETHVTENGSNFSQGQRQLICLARALLRSSRFVFLDEATASIDNETDALIQQTIRTRFADGTILTIAHRLRTVIDYDRILVLDQGNIAELGTPFELIQKQGIFARMCQESGEYDELCRLAAISSASEASSSQS